MKKVVFVLMICIPSLVNGYSQTKQESIKELIRLMKQDSLMNAMFKSWIPTKSMDSATQAIIDASKNKSFVWISNFSKKLNNEDMVAIYDKYFTEGDIKDLLDFYRSPSGRKIVKSEPDIQKDISKIMFQKYLPAFWDSMRTFERPQRDPVLARGIQKCEGHPTIFDYITNNNVAAIKNYKDSINMCDSLKATPLMWAIYKSDLNTVKLLIQKGADLHLKGTLTFTDDSLRCDCPCGGCEYFYGGCLVVAAGENKLDILEYLLNEQKIPISDKEYNPYTKDFSGWNALQWAVVKGHISMVEYLLKHGSDINATEVLSEKTPLMLAIQYGQIKMATYLVNAGADINRTDTTALPAICTAIYYKEREFAKMLFKKGTSLDKTQEYLTKKLLREKFGIKSLDEL